MLSIEDNEKITRTGPGTPMGELFRRFWLPVMLTSELAERDGAPVRLMILSERLVAFRDSNGTVGLLEERCPHRHASLYWGRNEEAGLRCVYHGWKFGTDGACLDRPAEPEGSRFKDHIRAIAYATHEAGGIIWAYIGPRDKEPPFPEFEFTLVPESHTAANKMLQQCNYLQRLEGDLDTTHVNFLHRSWKEGQLMMPDPDNARKRYLIAQTDFGLLCMARSDATDDQYYWRITPFQLPTFTMPPVPTNVWLGVVPIDDERMWGFHVAWSIDRPLESHDTAGSALEVDLDEKTLLPVANMANDYLRDVERQRTGSWTGIDTTKLQDLAVQEDQDGPIMRRHEEHLGVTDRAIVGARRLLLQLADDLARGIEPPHLLHPGAFCLHALSITAPRDADPADLWAAAQPSDRFVGALGPTET